MSSALWSLVGLVQREPSLVVLQGAFIAINVMGIYRWMCQRRRKISPKGGVKLYHLI